MGVDWHWLWFYSLFFLVCYLAPADSVFPECGGMGSVSVCGKNSVCWSIYAFPCKAVAKWMSVVLWVWGVLSHIRGFVCHTVVNISFRYPTSKIPFHSSLLPFLIMKKYVFLLAKHMIHLSCLWSPFHCLNEPSMCSLTLFMSSFQQCSANVNGFCDHKNHLAAVEMKIWMLVAALTRFSSGGKKWGKIALYQHLNSSHGDKAWSNLSIHSAMSTQILQDINNASAWCSVISKSLCWWPGWSLMGCWMSDDQAEILLWSVDLNSMWGFQVILEFDWLTIRALWSVQLSLSGRKEYSLTQLKFVVEFHGLCTQFGSILSFGWTSMKAIFVPGLQVHCNLHEQVEGGCEVW